MKNYLDIENLSLVEAKVKNYISEEEEKIGEFTAILTSFNSNYSSSCSDDIIDIEDSVSNSVKLLNQIHNNDILTLEKNVNKYKAIADMIDTGFEDVR